MVVKADSAEPALLRPIERDHGAPVLPALAVAGQEFVQPVLDAEKIGERRLEPELGEVRRDALIIRRIGKRDVVRMRRERLDEAAARRRDE